MLASLLLLALASGVNNPRTYEAQMLRAHNLYREQIGVPLLTWSDPLAERAQSWALELLRQDRFAPRRDGLFGENLFEITGGPSSPQDVVAAWMSEKAYYDSRTNTCRARCGHYTQVIWRDTVRVGCAVAHTRTREVWVCNYDPPGNIAGERPY